VDRNRVPRHTRDEEMFCWRRSGAAFNHGILSPCRLLQRRRQSGTKYSCLGTTESPLSLCLSLPNIAEGLCRQRTPAREGESREDSCWHRSLLDWRLYGTAAEQQQQKQRQNESFRTARNGMFGNFSQAARALSAGWLVMMLRRYGVIDRQCQL